VTIEGAKKRLRTRKEEPRLKEEGVFAPGGTKMIVYFAERTTDNGKWGRKGGRRTRMNGRCKFGKQQGK